MSHQGSCQILLTLSMAALLLAACSAEPQSTLTSAPATSLPIQPTISPLPPTPTMETVPTEIAPTSEPVSQTGATASGSTTIQSVKIANHAGAVQSKSEVWLEFDFNPGDKLSGSEIESVINDGSLELMLPSGESKTLQQVPHSLTESELPTDVWLPEGVGIQMSPPPAGTLPLNGMSFENYSTSPSGPQIRIPLEQLSDLSTQGQYQISWQSGSLSSNSVTFKWDGSKVTISQP